jgi:hypothetical protein
MVASLMDDRLSEGMPRTRVVSLLDPAIYEDRGVLSYGAGLRGSCEFLELEFGPDGRLEKWRRVES